jgi:hypothetical protein
MKKSALFLCFCLFCFISDISSQNNHPRILLSEGEEKAIEEKIRSEKTWANLHFDILNECDTMLDLPPLERIKTGIRLLSVSREALRRIFFLSYAYRMTGEDKYLKRAEQELLTVSNFTDWNPSHFLDVAEMTLGVAIGYDWLFHKLPEDSRIIIREAIIQKGIHQSLNDKYNWFWEAGNNWNQVCNAGMTFGALAVYESDTTLCKNIINKSIHSISSAMREYAPNGAYPEGYAYWEYGTTFNVLFLSALEKVFHTDYNLPAMPGFMNTAAYYEHMTGISGESFNYADCGDETGLTPVLFWFAQKTGNSSLLWTEKNFIQDNYRDNYLSNRILPAVMIWGTIGIEKINPPQELMWTGGGTTPVALMRTSWTEPNAIYVGFKGGKASSNHAHMDAGSFVMEANGVRWAIDLGKQDYESLESKKLQIWETTQNSERWKVFRYQNQAHNTLTINDKPHDVSGFAPVSVCSEHPGFMAAVSDLSAVFKDDVSSCNRGIAIVDKNQVIVQDEVVALTNQPLVFRWTMLTSADVTIAGENKLELKKNNKTLLVEVISDIPFDIRIEDAQSPNDYDAPNSGTILLSFENVIPAGKQARFTVFLFPENTKANKKIMKPLDDWALFAK